MPGHSQVFSPTFAENLTHLISYCHRVCRDCQDCDFQFKWHHVLIGACSGVTSPNSSPREDSLTTHDPVDNGVRDQPKPETKYSGHCYIPRICPALRSGCAGYPTMPVGESGLASHFKGIIYKRRESPS